MTQYEFGTKEQVARLLRLKSPNSVRHCRKYWIEGIHFYKNPGGDRTGYNYNLTLIRHWIQCQKNIDDGNHLLAMAEYQRSKRKVG